MSDSPVTVLLIGDEHERMTGPDQLPRAVAEACGNRAVLKEARDYAEADKILNDPAARVAVILLDQVFARKGCRLLREDLEPATANVPAFQDEQGMWIARRIARDFGRLRPPIYLFTNKGREVPVVERLCREGVLDRHYRDKPARYETGVVEYDALVSFLRRHLNPVAHVEQARKEGRLLHIDGAFGRFLDEHSPGWNRDTADILEVLIETAHRHTSRVLSLQTWLRARETGTLPDTRDAWYDEALWKRLLGRFGEVTRWRPWRTGQETDTAGRIVFFRAPTGHVLSILDPRLVPEELTGPQRGRLGRLLAFPETLENLAEPGLFRIPLPPSAPASPLPFLLGSYTALPPGGSWIPLAVLRERSVREGRPLVESLRAVMHAIKRGVEDDSRVEELPEGGGLLADAVLINRESKTGKRFESWRTPAFPLSDLEIPADPHSSEPLPWWYLRKLGARGPWMQALASWFAWGRMPDLSGDRSVERSWDSLGALLEGRDVYIDVSRWWQGDSRQGPAIQRHGRELTFPASTRCLRSAGQPPLRVADAVNLIECRLIVEQRDDGVLPLFDRLAFDKPVRLRRCRVEDANGLPAPLRFKDCLFHAGVFLDEMDLDSISLENCRFEGDASRPGLRVAGVRLTHGLTLDGAAGGKLQLGPGIDAGSVCLKWAGTVIAGEGWTVRDELQVFPGDAASLNLRRASLAGAVCNSSATGASLTLNELDMAGEMVLTGKLAVRLTGCSLRRSLKADKGADLALEACELRENLSCAGAALRQLALKDCRIGGSVDLSGSDVAGGLLLEGGTIGQAMSGQNARFGPFVVSGSSCVGAWLFQDAEFTGPVCLAQPGGKASTRLAAVVLRDQVDFSGARFRKEADFSHVVLEHEARFDHVHFDGRADFRGMQARGNLILAGSTFAGQALFDGMILTGVLEASECSFAEPASFRGASFGRPLRLARVRWPEPQDQPALVLTDAILEGPLDLADPLDSTGAPCNRLWADLAGASAASIGLGFDHMKHSLERSEKQSTAEQSHRLMALSRLFEASLIKEVRFAEADYFYRHAQHFGGHPRRPFLLRWDWWLNAIWGHGTRPGLAFLWLIVLGFVFAGLALITASADADTPAYRLFIDAYVKVLSGGAPETAQPAELPLRLVLGALLTFQVILLNLFFVALARKMLR